MKARWINLAVVAAVVSIATSWVVPGHAQDPLPSWASASPVSRCAKAGLSQARFSETIASSGVACGSCDDISKFSTV